MSNTAPVEKPQSSDASQATIAASSSTSTKRPFGIFDSMKSMCCWEIWSKIAVLTAAGVTQLTRMPDFASSLPSDFVSAMTPAFDALYAEGDPTGLDRPKMLSIGMHSRLLGRPGRITALKRFMAHVAGHPDVWVCRRIDIARHWIATHPYPH